MSTDYKPGTVAEVTVRPRKKGAAGGADYLAFWDGYHKRWITSDEGALDPPSNYWEHDVRPLVVLDLDDYDIEKFGKILKAILRGETNQTYAGPWARAAHDAVRQIEAQTKPPRIPEPGPWGVVEARGPLGENESPSQDKWVHTDAVVWRSRSTGYGVTWDTLIDPVLIREGVES